MHANDTEYAIPKYPLPPDKISGSKMFSICKADCSVNYKREDFLVPHRKGYYFWALVKQGSSRHWIDTKPYTLQANTFCFTVPHQVNLKEEVKPFSGFIVCFTDEFLALEENGLLRQLPIIQNPENAHQLFLRDEDVVFIEDTLDKIFEENRAHGNWQHGMLMSYMRVLA